jgi:hypothetical protein
MITGPPLPAELLENRGRIAAKQTKYVVRVATDPDNPKNDASSRSPRTASCWTRVDPLIHPQRPRSSATQELPHERVL